LAAEATVVPIELQAIFLPEPQIAPESRALIHLATASTHLHREMIFMVDCGSKNTIHS
jgi:hypothetical protein